MKTCKPELLIADRNGRLYNVPHVEAAGMKGGFFFRLNPRDLIELPYGSELFMLSQRAPVGYNAGIGRFVSLSENPYSRKDKACFAVAAFVSPGYVVTYNSPYAETKSAKMLPLFSYAAVTFYKGKIYTACVRVDREKRQDLRCMDIEKVRRNSSAVTKLFPRNRLIQHLKKCALAYGCPAAKNLFLSRYEAPLPTSPSCNSMCLGCISYQPGNRCPVTQPRISFVPRPEEIAEIALFHIRKVESPVVSFGQGCEGEPLMAGRVIEKAIRMIRRTTAKGIINMNTNASRPEVISSLFDAGLDSIRVSLNSAQKKYYTLYYKPRGYRFKDVLDSIKEAKKRGGFVSVNYLTMPGFTDHRDEFDAFRNFIKKYKIDMIQWRNLNFDPSKYFRSLKTKTSPTKLIGIREIITLLKEEFPSLMMGYFNPSRARIRRFRNRSLSRI